MRTLHRSFVLFSATLAICSAVLTTPRAFAHEPNQAISKAQINTLQSENRLRSRPDQDRQNAVNQVARFAKVSAADVRYERAGKSSYASSAPVELYVVGADQYEVNMLTDEIIQVTPAPRPENVGPKTYNNKPIYASAELEAKARSLISAQSRVRVDALTANHMEKVISVGASNKPGSPASSDVAPIVYHFFRWEDRSRNLEGMAPFIQVGFSSGGDLLSYTNTLSLTANGRSSTQSLSRRGNAAPLALSGVYIYANGGGYYSWYGPTAYRYFAENQGYCYFAGWCSPKNMEWTTSTISTAVNWARWDNINTSGQNGTLKVYTPCVHAGTTRARYQIVYQSGSYTTRDVNQAPLCNTWTQIAYLRDIELVELTDATGETTTTEVGFDEIQIIY